ncbi:glutathione hydrolase 3-like [Selaginella moellendorffii]|uniref:glutathione hydrolase 3-like n=1 Tax=Selaginella moellendorffii TaxID=88036 RepID=UPI000D1D0811|nr:glutathione hydrolase 3-like [Selaginella moellendorffii]|eukprot:XP_024540506.1 glutathione hydrolase 3-like [Selaginella moellendorffii]
MREIAPAAASKDMYAKKPSSKVDGASSAGVPGELAGLHLAWQHFGRLPWKSLLEPAIKLARDGFVVTPYLEFEIAQSLKGILAHRTLRKFLSPNGKLAKAGDVLRNEELARTLELITNEGPGGPKGRLFLECLLHLGEVALVSFLFLLVFSFTD